jgi:stress response protein YsnF
MNLPESTDPERRESGRAEQPHKSDETRMSAVQEQLEVGIDEVETGTVRVRKVIHQEAQPLSVELRQQHVEVRRVSVNRSVDQRYPPRQEGDTLVIPVFEYVPVVKMQLMVKEEVHVTTTESVQQVVREVTLNSEELVVERREGVDGEWRPEQDGA